MKWAVVVWAFGTPDVELEVQAGNVTEARVVSEGVFGMVEGVSSWRVWSTYPRQLEVGPCTDAYAYEVERQAAGRAARARLVLEEVRRHAPQADDIMARHEARS